MVLITTVAVLALIALAVTIASAAHAFMAIRRRPDFVRPRWFRSTWVAVPVAFVALLGLGEAYGRPAAWRPLRIPAGAMVPTLRVGDAILAEIRAYRNRPVVCGDVVIFSARSGLPSIKRVISCLATACRCAPGTFT